MDNHGKANIRHVNYLLDVLNLSEGRQPLKTVSAISVPILVEIHSTLMDLSYEGYIPQNPVQDIQNIILSLQDSFGSDKFRHLDPLKIAKRDAVQLNFLLQIFKVIFDHQQAKKAFSFTLLDSTPSKTVNNFAQLDSSFEETGSDSSILSEGHGDDNKIEDSKEESTFDSAIGTKTDEASKKNSVDSKKFDERGPLKYGDGRKSEDSNEESNSDPAVQGNTDGPSKKRNSSASGERLKHGDRRKSKDSKDKSFSPSVGTKSGEPSTRRNSETVRDRLKHGNEKSKDSKEKSFNPSVGTKSGEPSARRNSETVRDRQKHGDKKPEDSKEKSFNSAVGTKLDDPSKKTNSAAGANVDEPSKKTNSAKLGERLKHADGSKSKDFNEDSFDSTPPRTKSDGHSKNRNSELLGEHDDTPESSSEAEVEAKSKENSNKINFIREDIEGFIRDKLDAIETQIALLKERKRSIDLAKKKEKCCDDSFKITENCATTNPRDKKFPTYPYGIILPRCKNIKMKPSKSLKERQPFDLNVNVNTCINEDDLIIGSSAEDLASKSPGKSKRKDSSKSNRSKPS